MRRISLMIAVWVLLAATATIRADYRDDIGYTQLKAEQGGALPTGAGVGVTQVEAREDGEPFDATPNYQPNPADSQFAGKSIIDKSLPGDVSNHATLVGCYYYGLTTSIVPGTSTIDAYWADHWLGSGFLNAGTAQAPLTEIRRVQNHSWIGDAGGSNAEILRRLDYAINRDGFTSVVGLNNGSANTQPPLLVNAYNVISVGLTNGNHSRGTTTVDGAGRIKPEIVAPETATSFATPMVSAAATLLIDKAGGLGSVNAQAPQSVKAMLLAGATKSEFPTWSRTPDRPLDSVYGAGELNIFRSYHILTSGEQTPGTSALVSPIGWDLNNSGSGSNTYFFDVPAGQSLGELSAILTWNRTVASDFSSYSLANLDLQLYSADGFALGSLLDESHSSVDNIEHVYEQNLPAGRYALSVSTNAADTPYALAWYGDLVAVPEPTAMLLLAVVPLLLRRRVGR